MLIVLFIYYIETAMNLKWNSKTKIAKIKYDWNLRKFLVITIASLIPFGTFYIDKKYLTKLYSN